MSTSRMTKAYADSDTQSQLDERRQRDFAAMYKPSAHLDRLDRMRTEQPAEFAKVSPGLKIELGYYLETKAAHDALSKGD